MTTNIPARNKFKEGETVFARKAPFQPLTIRRYVDFIYYCRVPDQPNQKEQVYFERELISEADNKLAAGS